MSGFSRVGSVSGSIYLGNRGMGAAVLVFLIGLKMGCSGWGVDYVVVYWYVGVRILVWGL